MKYSLLKNDTKSMLQKLKEKYDVLSVEKKSESEKNIKKTENNNTQNTSNIRDDISKVGLSNTLMGTTQVLNNQNKSILKENTMSKIVLPIKQIILEFTADHIRDNAGKYAAGTMLGLGAAAGYLAGDPEHGVGILNHSGNDNSQHNPVNNSKEDSTTIKLQNGTDHHVDYRTGKGASLMDHLGNWGEDRANTNYHHNVMDAVNSNPSFLTSGEKIAGAGAGILGAGALGASLMARNKRTSGPTKPNFNMK